MTDTQTTQDTTYNGYTNYPTWAVSLWLDNDQYTQDTIRGFAVSTLAEFLAEDARRNPGFHSYARLDIRNKTTVQHRLADQVQEYVETLIPDMEASFVSDLFGWALCQVNWEEIAEVTLESMEE